MKVLLSVFVFLGCASALAGTCDLVSGTFKTVSSQCEYSHDGVKFFPEGGKEIGISFQADSKVLSIAMISDKYKLSYVADGMEQIGRPQFEGDSYTADCENNQIHIRGVFSAYKHPMITDFVVNTDGSMSYKQSFEGNNFVRICEMNRL